MNFLLPSVRTAALYSTIFDKNRSGKLEANELLAMGLFMAKTKVLKNKSVLLNKKELNFHLVESKNSSLRGNARKKKFAWDFHWTTSKTKRTNKQSLLEIQLPLLHSKEEIPIGVVGLQGIELIPTKGSVRLKKKQRAVCRISLKKQICSFLFRQKAVVQKKTNKP